MTSGNRIVYDVLWRSSSSGAHTLDAGVQNILDTGEFVFNMVTADLVEARPALTRELGQVVIFAPEELGATRARLLRAIAAHTPTTAVVPLTGHDDADATVRRSAALLGCESLLPRSPTQAPLPDLRVISVSDADDEVRHVVRGVIAAADDGVPFDRMAVLYASKSHATANMFAKTLLHRGVEADKLREVLARLSMWVGGIPAAEAAGQLQRAIRDYEKHGLASMDAWFPQPPEPRSE